MKTIIAGSRLIPRIVFDLAMPKVLQEIPWNITEVVSGHARGPDKFGESWAEYNNIPVKIFEANWSKFGRPAGIYRNVEMGEYADAAIIFWDLSSRGTQHMINCMNRLKKPIHIEYIEL